MSQRARNGSAARTELVWPHQNRHVKAQHASCFEIGRACVEDDLRMFRQFALIVLVSLPLLASQGDYDEEIEANCGIERWSVKTGTDPTAQGVDLSLASPVSIGFLSSQPHPTFLPSDSRISPIEITNFEVRGKLILYKLEDDSDYHLVLQDESGRTMIAEIPSPSCVGPSSPFLSKIATARQQFDSALTATTSFKSSTRQVVVQGVGFFDFDHGQTGEATNSVELHPVLDIKFDNLIGGHRHRVVSRTTCPTPSLILSSSQNSVCAGTPVTISWVASDPSASVTISGIGTGLPATGSQVIYPSASEVLVGSATGKCGTATGAVQIDVNQSSATASVSASPNSISYGGTATVYVTTQGVPSWSLTSSLGNGLSQSSGAGDGTTTVSYHGYASGTDTLALNAGSDGCGSALIRSTTIVVGSYTPPPPPPTGNVHCCDGTISPTCVYGGNLSGCCSHHRGVCLVFSPSGELEAMPALDGPPVNDGLGRYQMGPPL
jgi:hypothetical protein